MWMSVALPVALAALPINSSVQIADATEILVAPNLGRGGRIPVVVDAIDYLMSTGRFKAPKAGDQLSMEGFQPSTWKTLKVDQEGWFSDRATSGASYWRFESPTETPMMLRAAGHSMVYVNGAPRSGDIYGNGTAEIPVLVKKGTNEFLFAGSRGRIRFKLVPAPNPQFVQANDITSPDIIVGQPMHSRAVGLIVTNATGLTFEGKLELSANGKNTTSPVRITPWTNRKVAAELPTLTATSPGKQSVQANLTDNSGKLISSTKFEIEAKAEGDHYKVTFVSKIDNSVQYYSVRPAWPKSSTPAPALILSVHGASVEATNQAGAYGPKTWANIICATNRRPYGFDWEDWGRMDAMEVLADAKARFKPQEDRIYLTGHSMGGHGTWYIGATYPDQFAAIGPCAGWITFWSYGGAATFPQPTQMEQMLLRMTQISDTLKLADNYKQQGVFILHGDADETVPVQQARDMRKRLAEFHHNFAWFEQPRGGHWYDTTPEPGADCVDFAPMFDFFTRNRIPRSSEVRDLEFVTLSPEINATCHWAKIDAQIAPFQPSRIKLNLSVNLREVSGTTENVRRLVIDVKSIPSGDPITVKLDGMEPLSVPYPADGKVLLEKGTAWTNPSGWSANDRSAFRNGGFKSAFNHGFVLVYGTKGSREENEWSYNRARFDAEQWWYRGNGSVEIYSDQEYRGRIKPDQNVIIYGNADTNRAYDDLLKDAPIRVTRTSIKSPEATWDSPDLAIVQTYPRAGSVMSSVGLVGGTGLTGCRATDRLGYFRAGVHYPDVFVYSADMLAKGTSEIKLLGLFGPSWKFDDGEFAWRN